MNDIKLGDSHPLTEELKPLKVGGETSAIETAKKNARVTGDFEATGDITCDEVIVNTGVLSGGDLNLESESNIYLKNNGGTILFQDDSSFYASMTSVYDDYSRLILYERGGSTQNDLVALKCEEHGETTMSTVDDAGTNANLNFVVDGIISHDAARGEFTIKKNGTEFSVANSAFSGIILGYTTVGIDVADDSLTLGTSFAVTDSAHKVKFVAPPSGAVEIFVSVYGDLSRRQVYFGLSDNATYNALDVTHEHSIVLPGTSNDMVLQNTWVITGLTSGTAYEYWLGAKSSHTFSSTLRWGGDVTSEYAPFIMKATALPFATADYAVYG